MAILNFSDVLKNVGLDPKRVKLIRHSLGDKAGTALNYEVISEAVCSVRAARPLSADWKRRIDKDVQRRGR